MRHKYKYYTIYKITNILDGKYYIGCHSTNDLNDGYLGSGKYIIRAVHKYGRESFIKEILEFCENDFKMYEREREIVDENLISDEMTYNIRLGGKGGYIELTEEAKNRIKEKLRNMVLIRENGKAKYISKQKFYSEDSLYHGITYGMVLVRNVKTNDQTWVNKEEFESNENLVGITKGKISVKDLNGNKFLVNSDDERFLNGELVGITSGYTQTPESNLKRSVALKGIEKGKQKLVECPYCGKIGGISNMLRWHFDNCKNKIKI